MLQPNKLAINVNNRRRGKKTLTDSFLNNVNDDI